MPPPPEQGSSGSPGSAGVLRDSKRSPDVGWRLDAMALQEENEELRQELPDMGGVGGRWGVLDGDWWLEVSAAEG